MKSLKTVIILLIILFVSFAILLKVFSYAYQKTAQEHNAFSYKVSTQIPAYPNALYWNPYSTFASFCVGDFKTNCPHSGIKFYTDDNIEKVNTYFSNVLKKEGWKTCSVFQGEKYSSYFKKEDGVEYELGLSLYRLGRYWYGNMRGFENFSPKEYSITVIESYPGTYNSLCGLSEAK